MTRHGWLPPSAGRAVLAVLTCFAAGLGCHSATDPTPLCFVAPPDGTNQSALFKTLGASVCGTGGTSITPFAIPEGTFAATIRFVVNRAKPNATYVVQRAPETRGDQSADGICQVGDSVPPGSPNAAFITFPIPWLPGPKKTLTTDAEGSGSVEFEHRAPSLPRGSKFDVVMRLVDDETAPTSELRSGCMTVEVR